MSGYFVEGPDNLFDRLPDTRVPLEKIVCVPLPSKPLSNAMACGEADSVSGRLMAAVGQIQTFAIAPSSRISWAAARTAA